MKRRLVRVFRRRRAPRGPLTPLAIFLLATGLTIAFLSCSPTPPPRVEYSPLRTEQVPDVRVRLNRSPIQWADFSGDGGGYRLLDERGRVIRPVAGEAVRIGRRDGQWQVGGLSATAAKIVVQPAGEAMLTFNAEPYRGQLHLVASGADGFFVVNQLDMESYLSGVLARELISHWHPETYRALAIAARSFALHHLQHRSGAGEWDVNADQSSQVYGGVRAEIDTAWRAVRDTHGQVLTYGGSLFMPQYSSTCGGHVNPARVLRNAPDIPPLAGGQVCTDCHPSPRYRWEAVRIPKSSIHQALQARYQQAQALVDLHHVEPVEVTDYGRIVWLDVVDSRGTSMRIRAEDLRLSLLFHGAPDARKLYSMNCRIVDDGDALQFVDGRGFGHGVGLCQYGAQGKAARGQSAEQILQFYYPRSTITRAW